MLLFDSSNSIVTIPLVLWQTVFNITCLRIFTDGSAFSSQVIAEVANSVPVVVYNESNETYFRSCNILSVSENLSNFKPPKFLSLVNILFTAFIEDVSTIPRLESRSQVSNLSRYTRKIFFLISGILSTPAIYSFDESNKLRVVEENTVLELLEALSENSLKLPNFNRKNLFISVANHSVYSLAGTSNGNAWAKGFEYDSIEFFCSLVNLTAVIIPTLEIGTLSDCNATGIIADVINDRTDVGMGGIWLNDKIASTVEYLQPYDYRCSQYLVPRPSHVVGNSDLILLPFQETLWVSICVAILVGSCMKTVFAKFLKERYGEKYKSLMWSLFTTMTLLILRHYPEESENRGVMRPLFVSWSWLAFILVNLHSSQLAAVLVTPHYEAKAETIDSFLEKGYHWGGPSAEAPYAFQAPKPIFRQLWYNGSYKQEKSVRDRNARMEKTDYIVRGESIDETFFFVDHHIPSDDVIKKYEAASRCSQVFYNAPILPLGSPYSRIYSKIANRMREFGLRKHRKAAIFYDTSIKNFIAKNVFFFTASNKTKEFRRVNLSLISYPFILLASGHLMAIGIFVASHMYHKGEKVSKKSLAKKHGKVIIIRRFTYKD